MAISGSNSYIYDGYNRRVVAQEGSKTNYSVYNQSGQLLHTKSAEGGVNYIYLNKKLIAKDGVVPKNSAKQHYLPFGGSIEGEKNDVGYTGHKFDTALNLSYMQARYYDPVIGRFYSNDPIGFTGDVATFNRYSYVGNDPFNNTDPTGMAQCGKQTEGGDQCVDGHEDVSETSREQAYREAGMEDPSKPMADAAKKVAEGASEAGDLIEAVATPTPTAKIAVGAIIIGKVVKAGAASEKTAKDIAKRIEKDLGKEARRTFHDSKISGAGDRTKDELKEDARALYKEAGIELPKWLE